jgi:hypothetical protein
MPDIRLFHETAAATARIRSALELARSRRDKLPAAFGIDTALPQFHFHAGQPPSKFVVDVPGRLESHYRCSGHAARHVDAVPHKAIWTTEVGQSTFAQVLISNREDSRYKYAQIRVYLSDRRRN